MCSAVCGEGTQTKTRQCNNPAPAHGGAQCNGVSSQTQNCNPGPCPGDMFLNVVFVLNFSQIITSFLFPVFISQHLYFTTHIK